MEGNGLVAGLDQARTYAGAIDCDLHPAVPGMGVLLPYLDDYWREMVSVRALDRLNLSLTSYPQNSPLSCRPDWLLPGGRRRAPRSQAMQDHVLDRIRPRYGILNCLYGAQVLHSEDMAAAFCRATNDWIRDHWLNRDPRLRASIVIPSHNTELAVAEIERRADDFRFVQVLMLVSGESHARPATALADLRTGRTARPVRSEFTPAAPIDMRRPPSGGRPTMSRTIWRNPPHSRTSCKA